MSIVTLILFLYVSTKTRQYAAACEHNKALQYGDVVDGHDLEGDGPSVVEQLVDDGPLPF